MQSGGPWYGLRQSCTAWLSYRVLLAVMYGLARPHSGVCHSLNLKSLGSSQHCGLAVLQAHFGNSRSSSSRVDAAPWARCCGHSHVTQPGDTARLSAWAQEHSCSLTAPAGRLGCSLTCYQSPHMHAGESAGLRAPPMFHASFVLHGATLRTDKGPTQSFCEHTGRWTGPSAKVHSQSLSIAD